MAKLNRIVAVLVVLMLALGSAADADAKRKKKKRKKKKRRKAKIEKVVTPPPEMPLEPPPAEPEAAPEPEVASPPEEPPTDEQAGDAAADSGEPAPGPPEPEGAPASEDVPATAPESTEAGDAGQAGETEIIEAAPESEGAAVSEETAAEVVPEAEEPAEIFPVTGAIKLGTVVPGVFSALDAALFGTAEVGYVLPFLGQRLVVLADFSYSRPERISRYDYSDPRLPGDGSYRFYYTEDQYSIGIGVLGRLFQPRSNSLFGLNFYGKLTGRLELQHAAEGARAVNTFGRNEETATRGAIFFAAGAEYVLGPGAILVELSFAWAPLEHELSGNVGTGGLGVVAGYAFLFGG